MLRNYQKVIIDDLKIPPKYTVALKQFYSQCKKLFGNNIKLFIVTGSCGTQTVIPGWSDIDILLVVSQNVDVVISNLSAIKMRSKIKIGVTFYTINEFQDVGKLDSKTLWFLHSMSCGIIHPQIIDSSLIKARLSQKLLRLSTLVQINTEIQVLKKNLVKFNKANKLDHTQIKAALKNLYNVAKFFLIIQKFEAKTYSETRNMWLGLTNLTVNLPPINQGCVNNFALQSYTVCGCGVLDFISKSRLMLHNDSQLV